MTSTLLRLHFYAGIVIGPFLLVAAVTGLLYTATPQLEQALYQHELKVTPDGPRDSLASQVAAAKRAVPDGTPVSVTVGAQDDDSTRVVFEQPGLREGYTRTAFVDPYSHEVLGTLETYDQWLPVRAWFDDLHRNLHLGDLGRNYSEIAASWLWVEVAGGLVLWTGARRSRARLRRTLLPQTRAPAGRRRVRSWHGAVGLWAAAGLLGLSATGLTWSAYAGESVSALREAFDSTTPAVSAELPRADPPSGKDVGYDGAVRAARGAGLDGVLVVTPPAGAGTGYTVKENTRSWPVRQDSVAVDPATGEVTSTLRFADYPVAAKLTRWGIDAHMGLLFGLANQIALALLALALIALVLWGYRMWWLRRPTRARAGPGARSRPRPGRAPAAGGWRRIPGAVLAPAVLVTALLAYWLPWFGIPLALFLTADLTLGAARRRRRTRPAGE
ncbi:PepSY domain-containing protein, partial [Streptomyces boncukensis]|uniref:PepSY-associated TM helix domain-containing protein n=1 Tax=Streptomyces boncukensis TaxID=2711219 RepID=UPI0030B9EB2C